MHANFCHSWMYAHTSLDNSLLFLLVLDQAIHVLAIEPGRVLHPDREDIAFLDPLVNRLPRHAEELLHIFHREQLAGPFLIVEAEQGRVDQFAQIGLMKFLRHPIRGSMEGLTIEEATHILRRSSDVADTVSNGVPLAIIREVRQVLAERACSQFLNASLAP